MIYFVSPSGSVDTPKSIMMESVLLVKHGFITSNKMAG